ncbi:carbonic anhydrase 1-like [Ctenocephalides felis]|uniref:carbonic anhydrase 1-like n=1 Tax=Ctenocephalides felis TaxID=7515 RepID=UPI000E6E1483|nr:carbonic anhydrase 1-like [Ctenocephalides felis]
MAGKVSKIEEVCEGVSGLSILVAIIRTHEYLDVKDHSQGGLASHQFMRKLRGDEAPVRRLSIRGLLPDTEQYMTYEGSTTAPACHETVTWIVINSLSTSPSNRKVPTDRDCSLDNLEKILLAAEHNN